MSAQPSGAVGRPRRPRRRLGIDGALLIGALAFAAMIGLALYGPIVAPHDPFDTNFLFQGKIPPYDPSPTFPLGTDAAGRDRLSLLLWGARNTFSIAFAAAALRLGIGAFLGVVAGWQGGSKERWLTRLALGVSSVPATILALMAVIAFNVYAGALAFILALGLFGWGDAFHQARRATRTEAAREFIETARTIGLSETRVVLRHLVPNIAPALVMIGALQISAVLLLLAELALLRIFLGGSVNAALFDQPLLLPSAPEWAALLGTTRPIFDLYGNTVAVLAPAGALLAAVVSINLFADALARRAQRLDIFGLFSPRQAIAVGVVACAIVLPALLWPSRLAPQLDYAQRFDAPGALALAHDLADPRFAGRIAQTAGAAQAADFLAQRIGGVVAPIHEQIVTVADARLAIDDRTLALGDELGVLTPHDASVTAPLAFANQHGATFGGASFARAAAGRIAVIVTQANATVSVWEGLISRAGGVGLIVITDNPAGLFPSTDYPIPTVRVSASAFRTLLGRDLPVTEGAASLAPLDVHVTLSVSAPPQDIGGTNVIARVGTVPNAPLILVAAPYDAPSTAYYLDYPPSEDTASASAVLVAAAAQLQASPLRAEVVFALVGSQAYDSAGLKSALRSLSADEQRRLVAVISLPSALAMQVSVRSDWLDALDPAASARVAGRVANALGDRSGAQFGPQLPRAVSAAGVRVPTFEISSFASPDTAPTAEALASNGRALLALLAYLADHPETLR